MKSKKIKNLFKKILLLNDKEIAVIECMVNVFLERREINYISDENDE